MKKVVTTPPVEVALRMLDANGRRKVHSWFTHLANWDGDAFIRSHSHSLDSVPGVYVLKTSTDLRVFFRIDGETVTILDVGSKQSILASGDVSGVG